MIEMDHTVATTGECHQEISRFRVQHGVLAEPSAHGLVLGHAGAGQLHEQVAPDVEQSLECTAEA